jgi:hypothetical protein
MTAVATVGVDMTLEQIKDTINSLIQQGHNSTYQIGLLYNHVVDKKLAVLAGYKDARDFFSQHVKAISQATLTVYGRVARGFPEAVVNQYGPYKLRALLAYAEVAGIVLGVDPSSQLIDVPQDNGTLTHKSFADCTVDELQRASKAKTAPPKVAMPVADRVRLMLLGDSLGRTFSDVSSVRMTSRSLGGQTVLTVENVPVAQLERLIQALQEGASAEPTLRPRV